MGEILAAIGANIEVIHIVLFALGIICMVIELFEPGLGIFGAAGLILMIIDIFVLAENWVQGFVLFAALAVILMVFLVLIVVLTAYGIIPKKLVLKASTNNNDGYTAIAGNNVKVGDVGKAITLLRPSGKAQFGEVTVDVVSDGEFIEAGTEVKVVSAVGNRIVVKINGETQDETQN